MLATNSSGRRTRVTSRRRRFDVVFYAPALGPLLGNDAHTAAGGAETQVYLVARALWTRRFDQHELASRCRRYVAAAHSEETVSTEWIRALELLQVADANSALVEVA